MFQTVPVYKKNEFTDTHVWNESPSQASFFHFDFHSLQQKKQLRCPLDTTLQNLFGYIQLGGDPREDSENKGRVTYLIWSGSDLGSTKKRELRRPTLLSLMPAWHGPRWLIGNKWVDRWMLVITASRTAYSIVKKGPGTAWTWRAAVTGKNSDFIPTWGFSSQICLWQANRGKCNIPCTSVKMLLYVCMSELN